MKHISKETVCERARIFYYDYIQDARLCTAEPEVFRHIEECKVCQSEIERLKVVLAEAATEKTDQKNIQVTTILASHFNLMNREVTCGTAKRFLPNLAGLSFDIRIPTPITVHIENCTLCRNDLETIRKLKLTGEQLTRLGRVIASQMTEHDGERELYSGPIDSSVAGSFGNDTLAVLKHIVEREESGIVTTYIAKKRMDVEILKDLSNDYTNWPVEVVIHSRKKRNNRQDRFDWQCGWQPSSYQAVSQAFGCRCSYDFCRCLAICWVIC